MSDSRRSPVVEKLLQHPAALREAQAEARDTHQNARQHSREAIMLDIRLSSGEIESFSYTDLSRIRFKPGDSLVLKFGRDEVKVGGRNLGRLREIISEHRARFIQEGTETEEKLKSETEEHIDRIEITEGEE